MGNIPASVLRLPPLPRCRSSIGDPRSNMAPAPTTTVKADDLIHIESLPDELLIEILVCLSADDLYEKARVVCRRWHHLIHTDSFVYAHLHRTSFGLLLTEKEGPPVLLAATTQGRIEVSRLSYRIGSPILASCNGLVLEVDYFKKYAPYIVNPATRSPFILPPFVHRDVHFGIAYAAASMEYKVVVTYQPNFREVQCSILTVGVDNTWRNVSIERPPPYRLPLCAPLITEGFMHWTYQNGFVLMSLNVEDEVLTKILVPRCQQKRRGPHYYLSAGRYLTLLFRCDKFLWEVWEMKPETGEWRKLLPNIDLEAHKSRIQHCLAYEHDVLLFPVGWVKYPEVLAFFSVIPTVCSCILYNLDTDQIDSIELPSFTNSYRAVVHRNSLVWLS